MLAFHGFLHDLSRFLWPVKFYIWKVNGKASPGEIRHPVEVDRLSLEFPSVVKQEAEGQMQLLPEVTKIGSRLKGANISRRLEFLLAWNMLL